VSRRLNDWLKTYVDYASHTEAPKIMHFWAGVWAIAATLRKKVWIDQVAFRWCPNFFIIFVAPPGIVSKSTTAGMAERLIRDIPGIKFGPDVVTWPALVTAFATACEAFEHNGEWHPMSPLNLIASELGNLIDPTDKGMVNLFIDLWDGRKTLDKQTKMSGNDLVEGPWINLLGCTTPHWIADNMPSSTVGGGLTSRCVFVYAEQKERFIAYPKYHFPADTTKIQADLVHDLEWMAMNLCGEYELTPEARKWGEEWYEQHWNVSAKKIMDDRLDGYMARKQTHMHKLAIVLAASQRDELCITVEDLRLADHMLQSTEADLHKVFSRIGKSEESIQSDRFITYIRKRGECPYDEAYRMIHAHFPDFREFEGILSGAIRSGMLKLTQKGDAFFLVYTGDD
jgi:hypothetical protein